MIFYHICAGMESVFSKFILNLSHFLLLKNTLYGILITKRMMSSIFKLGGIKALFTETVGFVSEIPDNRVVARL